MKIIYNDEENSIEIKDDLKNSYFLVKSLIVLNLVNAVIRLINIEETGFGFQEILWLIIGLISLIVLYFFLYRKTTADKINLSSIKRLKEKSILGRKRYSIELTNGKQRDLIRVKSDDELVKLKKILNDSGVRK